MFQVERGLSPDGKYLVFSRAPAVDAYPQGRELAQYAKTQTKFRSVRPLPDSLYAGKAAGRNRFPAPPGTA